MDRVPAYATISGILALILAILSFLIPVIGPVFITPFAILFGMIAMLGGAKGWGIATLIIVVVNLVISPSFWANIWAGEAEPDAYLNRFITYFDAIGVILLFVFVVL